jgi:hypothetical protein
MLIISPAGSARHHRRARRERVDSGPLLLRPCRKWLISVGAK